MTRKERKVYYQRIGVNVFSGQKMIYPKTTFCNGKWLDLVGYGFPNKKPMKGGHNHNHIKNQNLNRNERSKSLRKWFRKNREETWFDARWTDDESANKPNEYKNNALKRSF